MGVITRNRLAFEQSQTPCQAGQAGTDGATLFLAGDWTAGPSRANAPPGFPGESFHPNVGVITHSGLQAELLQAITQRVARDAEALGRLGLIPAGLPQGLLDHRPLPLREVDPRRH